MWFNNETNLEKVNIEVTYLFSVFSIMKDRYYFFLPFKLLFVPNLYTNN